MLLLYCTEVKGVGVQKYTTDNLIPSHVTYGRCPRYQPDVDYIYQ